jgi:membrane-associated phospholipid phosphatase
MFRPIATLLAVLAASPARADEPRERPVDQSVDGAIVAGAVVASLAPMALRLRDHGLWDSQPLGGLDAAAYDQLSRRAAQLSDLLLMASVAAPAVYLTGSTIEDADGDRLVLYAETLAVDLAVVQLVKYLVPRPRPYLYNHGAAARRLAEDAGDDAWRSFYSSHAAISFGAAVAGAYLLAASNAEPYARAAAWASGFAIAAATSTLRVRAGRHFPSDVMLGGLVGCAIGYAVPALHARGKPVAITRNDAVMAGLGIAGGVLLGELVPAGDPDDVAPVAARPLAKLPAVMVDQLHLGPLGVRDGAGLALSGRIRSRWGRVPLSSR